MEDVDCVVVGAGVVGIAIARALALAGREVIVLEMAGGIGTATSSRNSGVIHAGIYYPRDSLMARFCVRGRWMLYAFCAECRVPFNRCGKLIVATTDHEVSLLADIKARAEANGVEGIRLLGSQEASSLEPDLFCLAALLSPETGVIDGHSYMLALQGEAEAAGALVAFNSPVIDGKADGERVQIRVGGADPMSLRCRVVINAAGLHAPALARRITGMPGRLVPAAFHAKGNYFALAGASPFKRLIYPVPVPGGLGVHLTLDMGGQARFGPDVEWVDAIDYSVNPDRAAGFYTAIRKYWPGLKDGALRPDYCGIRPKITPPNSPGRDFMVQDASLHGVAGLINLFGIESPGLTAAIALAEFVRELANSSNAVR